MNGRCLRSLIRAVPVNVAVMQLLIGKVGKRDEFSTVSCFQVVVALDAARHDGNGRKVVSVQGSIPPSNISPVMGAMAAKRICRPALDRLGHSSNSKSNLANSSSHSAATGSKIGRGSFRRPAV